MAAAANVDISEHHLECAICLEMYNNPKELTCRHPFCKSCLDGMLKFKNDGSAIITCPNCRKQTVIGRNKTTNNLNIPYILNGILDEYNAKKKSTMDDMAKNIPEELKCRKCCKIYDNPRELDCGDTFCKSCLDVMLQYEDDGSVIIECVKCEYCTIINAGKTTNDLKLSDLVSAVAEYNASCRGPGSLEKTLCGGTIACENDVYIYCLVCRIFMCRSCGNKQNNLHVSHGKKPITAGEDNLVKVFCKIHKTVCEYMCCDNEVTCVYCVNRKHANHHYKLLKNEMKLIKESLRTEVEKLQQIPQISFAAKQSISTSEKHFEQALKTGKIMCLSKYISLLNTEEIELREKFRNATVDHENEFKKSADKFNEILKWTNVEFGLLKENILDSILEHRLPNELPCRTAYLRENNFTSDHPLGELLIAVEEVAVNDFIDASNFKYNVPEVEEEVSTSILLGEMKELVEEAEFTNHVGCHDTFGCPLKDIMGIAVTEKQNELQKEYITSLQEECVQSFEISGFKYVEELIGNDERCDLHLLISGKPDVITLRGENDETPLHVAARHNQLAILKQLLKNGGNIDDKDKCGGTVLHDASASGSEETVSWLCEKYSHLWNVRENEGGTALHAAVFHKEENIVTELCKYDINLNIKMNNGATALDIAKFCKLHDCIQIIQKGLQERQEVDEGLFNDCHSSEEIKRKYEGDQYQPKKKENERCIIS